MIKGCQEFRQEGKLSSKPICDKCLNGALYEFQEKEGLIQKCVSFDFCRGAIIKNFKVKDYYKNFEDYCVDNEFIPDL